MSGKRPNATTSLCMRCTRSFRELDTPAYWGLTLEAGLVEVDEIVADGLAFVVEEDGEIVGFVLARRREGTRGLLSDIYVRPKARQNRHATRLTRATAAEAADRHRLR
ncbi:MAG TPA: GNAT family N-acetyltransferase [Gaiellaceae bacterium]|nr:GNAT family N-acetyltransferase [Gaiellaceae bacterium]